MLDQIYHSFPVFLIS